MTLQSRQVFIMRGREHSESTLGAIRSRRTQPSSSRLKGAWGVEKARERIPHLYEISKELTRFESIKHSIPAAIELVGQTIPLRSAVLVLDTPHEPPMLAWDLGGYGMDRLRAAKAHARTSWECLIGTPTSPFFEPNEELSEAREQIPEHESGPFLVLPLVVGHRPVFGALQIESAGPLDEMDLWFVNAAANQIAIAIDRQVAIDNKQRVAEAKTLEAEEERDAAQQSEGVVRDQLDFARAVTASLGESVLAVDLDERITLFNPAAAQVLGEAETTAIGRRAHDVVRVHRADGTPLSAAESPLTLAIESGVAVRSEEHLFSGSRQPASPVGFTASPLRRGGRISGAVLAFRDITDVKRREREQHVLAELSTQLASSLDAQKTLDTVMRFIVPFIADGCFLDEVDPSGALRHVASTFTGPTSPLELPPETRSGAPWVLALDGSPLVLEDVTHATIETMALDERDARFIRAAGIESLMLLPLSVGNRRLGVLSFALAGSGRHFCVSDLAFAQEIARRVAMALDNARLYGQAQQAIHAREELLAVVSHDLRNALGTILMSAGILLERGPQDRRIASRRMTEALRRSAERMTRLINDLLDAASIDAGRFSVNTTVHPVRGLVSEAVEAQASVALQKSIRLVSELPDHDAVYVECDAGRILQVLANLIGNAVKFTPNGGDITVRAEETGREAQFSVIDTGAGVGAAELEHVFDRFWQAKRTAHMGEGLGLWIAKGIVEAHGGRIWAESRVGEGTAFFFTLPRAHPDVDRTATAESATQ